MATTYRMLTKGDPAELTAADFHNFGELRRQGGKRTLWVLETGGDRTYTGEELRPVSRNADGHWTTPVAGLVWKPFRQGGD